MSKQKTGFTLRLSDEAEIQLIVLMAEEMKATGKRTNKTKHIEKIISDKFRQIQKTENNNE